MLILVKSSGPENRKLHCCFLNVNASILTCIAFYDLMRSITQGQSICKALNSMLFSEFKVRYLADYFGMMSIVIDEPIIYNQ